MTRLKAEQEQREYDGLVGRGSSATMWTGTGSEEEEDNISPSLVLNILLSVVLCALAVFHVTRFWSSDGWRVLVSLMAGIVVGVAEVTVYAGYLRKVADARRKERNKKEVKQFVQEYTGEAMEVDRTPTKTSASIEKVDEIWGRGVNGGMRRRLREKWERNQQ